MFLIFWVLNWIFYVAEWLCVGATIFTELLSSFIYPETNYITETISLIILMGFLIPEILKLIIQGIYMIYLSYRVSTKKIRRRDKEIDKCMSDDSSSDSSSDESEHSDDESRNGWRISKFWKHRMTTSSIVIILTFLILSLIFLIIVFNAVYIDWKYYANNNEEFIIDIYAFFKRDAFVGPIVQTNGTALQPIRPGAVTVWVLHALTIMLILITFILFIVSLTCFFVFVIREIQKYRPRKRKKKKKKNIKQDPIYSNLEQTTNDIALVLPFGVSDELTVTSILNDPPNMPNNLYPQFEPKTPQEVDIEEMNLHQKVNNQLQKVHKEIGERQSMVNPESLDEVREQKLKPNTRE